MTRVSANKADPGYPQWKVAIEHGKTVRVFLDGVEVKDCTTADDVNGFVVRAVLDDAGRFQVDPVDPNQVWEETVTGKVEIRFE